MRQLGLADSGLNRVRHVVRWIRERYAEPVRVEDLARLQEARLRLVAHPGDVTGTAYAVGGVST
ncbi:Atg1 family protein [Actinotalea sp. K2]|nr:Atg1 family protein [Actinotalea sp. K2]